VSITSKILQLVAISTVVVAANVAAADALKITDLVITPGTAVKQERAVAATAKQFYEFWNTGDEQSLKQAIALTFTDHTLPPGRPQGPDGPAFASRQFRAAVPDLSLAIRKMIVAGDDVTVHMVFSGHFSGTFGKTKGTGQPIEFIATDLLKVTSGKVTDNWHIEDNLTLLKQMGVAVVH
jgi:predicted ester cyclase